MPQVRTLAVAKQLKYYRKKFRLTQTALAKMLNVDRTTYVYYETGKVIPSLKRIFQIADFYGIPYTALIDDYYKEVKNELL